MFASTTFQLPFVSSFLNRFLNQPRRPMHEAQKTVLSSSVTILYLSLIITRVLVLHFSLKDFPLGALVSLTPPSLKDRVFIFCISMAI